MPQKKILSDLDDLIFYAVDKASPYALALNEADNSLEKIRSLTLEQLAITAQGAAIMWLWINAHSAEFGAKPVPATVAGTAKTVADVEKLVRATMTAR